MITVTDLEKTYGPQLLFAGVTLQLNKGERTEWDDPELVDRYLAMYVSGLTLDMGERGRDAIETFLGRAADLGLCHRVENLLIL